jgi:Mrp family chromosome partitioning ATPase
MSENASPVPSDEALWDEGRESGPPQGNTHPAARLLTALRGRWHWAIALALLLGAGAAAGGYFSQASTYKSLGTLRVQPREDQLLYPTPDKDVPYMYEAWLETQISRITTPPVIRKAMNSASWQKAVQGVDDPPTRKDFEEAIEAEPTTGYEVGLTFVAAHKQLAKPGADAVLEAFVNTFRAQDTDQEDRFLRLLEDRKANLKSKLDQLERRKANHAGTLDTEALRQQYQFVQEQVHAYERQLNEIEMALVNVDGSDRELKDMSIAQLASVDRRMRELFDQKERLERTIDMRTTALGLGHDHRSIVTLRGQLQQIKQEIQQYAQRIRRGEISLQSDPNGGAANASLGQLRQRKEQLAQQKEQAKARLLDLGERLRKIRKLDEQMTQLQERLEETAFAIEKRTVESQVRDRVKIAGYGSDPLPANQSTRRKLAVLAGVGGSAMGFGVVVLLGLLNRRIRHVGEAQTGQRTNRMLGVLPTLPNRLTDPEQAESAALAVHHIRTLLQIGPRQQSRVYTITSPAAGSGKTSLSIALGLSFAASQTRTLLIDCDLVGAGLTHRLGAEKRPSLGTWLKMQGVLTEAQLAEVQQQVEADGQSLEEVLTDGGYVTPAALEALEAERERVTIGVMEVADGIELSACLTHPTGDGLSVLPVGASTRHQAGSLSPAALHRVVDAARGMFDIVLIDTGPVLGSLEASMAAVESDGTVFIVSRGDQKSLSFRSLDALHSINAPMAGIVFNHADDDDMLRSSYTATSMPRQPGQRRRRPLVPRDQTRRYGPLASAVVACGQSNGDEPSIVEHE